MVLSAPPIIGLALTGVGTAHIADTDGGRLDGDSVYDHAVGPMQFIPSTWARYASDGNGDMRSDPFNINDAARAGATYLCAAGGDLTTDAGRVRAVLAYNHSAAYVATVLTLAATYAGEPTPSLSTVETALSPLPEASPGPPLAVGPISAPPSTTPPAATPAPTAEPPASTAGQHTAGQHPAGQHPTGQHPAGQHPTGQHPTGQHPTGQHPTGQHPTGQHPTGQHPTGQHPTGQHPTGQHPTGQHPTGQHPTGQHPTGQHPTGRHTTSSGDG